MLKTFINALKIPDMRKKLLYVFVAIIVVRIGCQLPVPGIDTTAIRQMFESFEGLEFLESFTGGSFSAMSIFALNITPYITSSIIVQLLTVRSSNEKLYYVATSL